MKLLFVFLVAGWLVLTLFCACKLAADADALARALRRKNRRRHNLGKWLLFHGGIK